MAYTRYMRASWELTVLPHLCVIIDLSDEVLIALLRPHQTGPALLSHQGEAVLLQDARVAVAHSYWWSEVVKGIALSLLRTYA